MQRTSQLKIQTFSPKAYFFIGCQSKDNSLKISKRSPKAKIQSSHMHSHMVVSIQHTLAFKGNYEKKKKKRQGNYPLLSASDRFPPHYKNETGIMLELPYTKVLHVPKSVFNLNKRISNCRYV